VTERLWHSAHKDKWHANPPAGFVQRAFFTHRGIACSLSPARRRDARKSPLHSQCRPAWALAWQLGTAWERSNRIGQPEEGAVHRGARLGPGRRLPFAVGPATPLQGREGEGRLLGSRRSHGGRDHGLRATDRANGDAPTLACRWKFQLWAIEAPVVTVPRRTPLSRNRSAGAIPLRIRTALLDEGRLGTFRYPARDEWER